MSREEVKTAINEILENIPEEALQDVFDYLKSVQDKSTASIILSKNLSTILKEDKELRKISKMISEKEAIEIHSILIDRFGGSKGIRDKELLNSALNRPYQTFDGKELYPEVIDKAAAILESIVKNHRFSDGNKRTGYVLARLIIMDSDLDIYASEDQKYQLVILVSKGEVNFDYIKEWLKKQSR